MEDTAIDLRPREHDLDGQVTRWLEHGSGRTVVLVHGIPTSPRLWRHVMPLVRGRSLAWEMAGYGSSIPDGDGLDLSLAAQADRLLRWLDAQGIEAPVLVGHDLGAASPRSLPPAGRTGSPASCSPTRSAATPGPSRASG